MIKICENCNGEFKTYKSGQKYCSKKCSGNVSIVVVQKYLISMRIVNLIRLKSSVRLHVKIIGKKPIS